MCGIAGTKLPADSAELQKMIASIQHRGPDDSSWWRGKDWQLGMTRLAIMDPARGRQPMHSANGRWTIVLNGEIYNFRTLREHLSSHTFQTNTDTEVLLEWIATYGVPAALEAIEGMFAFAAVDAESDELWLARDRFGEKPLFLDRRIPGFAFCSELAPLWQRRNRVRVVDPAGVVALLRLGHPWPGTTAVSGISELLPAHWLRRTSSGDETLGCYWRPPDCIDEQAGTLQQCGEKLLSLLDESVRYRLVADVPLGMFLSGGIDSSAVAASAVRVRPDIQAVTVGFDTSGYDERPLARQTANYLGINLIEEQGNYASYSRSFFDDILQHYGEPFADTSAIPTRAVSRIARKYFKVVLSGDGGDELLAGYMSHQRDAFLRRMGGGALGGTVSSWLASSLPRSGRWEGLNRGLRLSASRPEGLLLTTMNGVFADDQINALVEGTAWQNLAEETMERIRDDSRELWFSVKDSTLAFSLYALRTTFPQDILMKVDRMSMAESLEVRAPFLDSKLASYALSLPRHHKIRGKLGKWVLRRALQSRVPEHVLTAPKRGFTLPVREWLGEKFWRDLLQEVSDYRQQSPELNPAALRRQVVHDEKLCRRVNSFRALHRSVLIYSFLLWRKQLTGTTRPYFAPPTEVE